MKHKRRLNATEIEEIRVWFENSGQGMKPSIRQIAKKVDLWVDLLYNEINYAI